MKSQTNRNRTSESAKWVAVLDWVTPAMISAGFAMLAALAFWRLALARLHHAGASAFWDWNNCPPLHWLWMHQVSWLKFAAVLLAAVAVFSLAFPSWVNRACREATETFMDGGGRQILGLQPVVFGVVAVAVLIHLPQAYFGWFLSDDWAILRLDRTLPLWKCLLIPNTDHPMPGYRFEVAVLDGLFGAHASGWNLATLAVYGLTLWLLALTLRRLGVHSLAASAGLLVFALGGTSTNLFAGMYVIWVPVQNVAALCGAFLAYDCAAQTGLRRWECLGAGVLLCGMLLDVQAVWILAGPPLLLYAASDTPFSWSGATEWLRHHQRWVAGWLAIGVAVVGIYAALILHNQQVPGARHDYNSYKPLSFTGVLSQSFFYLSSGVILQLATPPGTNWPVSICAAALLSGLMVLALAVVYGTPRDSRTLLAVTALLGLFALEVAVGRPMNLKNDFYVQYITPAHLLAIPIIGLILTVMGKLAVRYGWQARGFACLAGGCAVLVACSAVPTFFHYSKVVQSQFNSKREIADLGRILEKLVTSDGNIHALPVIETASLRAWCGDTELRDLYRYPVNKDLYDLQCFLPVLVQSLPLVRNAAMNTLKSADPYPPCNVTLVDSLRTACGPGFAQALARIPEALQLYGAPIYLTPTPALGATNGVMPVLATALHDASQITTNEDEGVTFHSNGATELWVHPGTFDPEQQYLLTLECRYLGIRQPVKIKISCRGEPVGLIETMFLIAPGSNQPYSLDLRRLPIFAVNQTVSDLRLSFPTDGTYRVNFCRF